MEHNPAASQHLSHVCEACGIIGKRQCEHKSHGIAARKSGGCAVVDSGELGYERRRPNLKYALRRLVSAGWSQFSTAYGRRTTKNCRALELELYVFMP